MEENKCNGMCENCNMGDDCGYNAMEPEEDPDFLDIIFKAIGVMAIGIVLLGIGLASC